RPAPRGPSGPGPLGGTGRRPRPRRGRDDRAPRLLAPPRAGGPRRGPRRAAPRARPRSPRVGALIGPPLTRRGLLALLGATACTRAPPPRAAAEPSGPVHLGWRWVPGARMAWRTRI